VRALRSYVLILLAMGPFGLLMGIATALWFGPASDGLTVLDYGKGRRNVHRMVAAHQD
jgi:hypothetical protein